MFEVDGSQKSGSGTLLRLAVALSAIQQQPLHITNIRQNRPQPGLKHQHLEAVLTAAKLCNANVEGVKLGSRELYFTPRQIRGGAVEATIETAGSIPMLMLAVLPICLYAEAPVRLHVAKGGTDTTHAPTINYLKNVLLPSLKPMGVEAEITVQKYGYYPKGGGEATLTVQPNPNLQPLKLESFGKLLNIQGISVCTGLADRQVAARQAKAATDTLHQGGYNPQISVVNDQSNVFQKGSSITLWGETTAGVHVGSDGLGELRKMAEAVGKEAAQKLLAELVVEPTVDVFLADMLLPYMALAKGNSAFLVRCLSEHIESNLWLLEEMLNVKFSVSKHNRLIKIEKCI
jgi:RNA 3'-terminal phosphate cyclase (ATP)